MKSFTFIVTLFLTAIGSYAQNWGGIAPNCQLPTGYTLSQGDRMVTYNNPLDNCREDCGILTPGVGGNNPGNIIFPSGFMGISDDFVNGISTEYFLIRFNIFSFDANLTCASNQDFQCSTFVSLYIVDEAYNSVQAPSAAEMYGMSKPYLVKARGTMNSFKVNFSKTPDSRKKYRVFLDFGKGTTCVQQNTKYIIDLLTENALPVNLSSFLVGRSGSNVTLNWKTEIEMNALNFEVQRSDDNVTFKTIATVQGASTGSSSKSYSYVDKNNTSSSVSFYRLKLIKRAEINYSDIKTVKGILAKAGFVLFPNPAVSNSKITISDVIEPTRVQLHDNSGRIVKTLMLNNTNTVELNGLVTGNYMVKIIGSVSGHTEVKKLTVIK